MTNIKLQVNGASASAKLDGILTSGMIGVSVKIDYDNTWDGLTKTAVFRAGNFSRDRKNIGTVTTVPWEVLRYPGRVLEIGLVGKDAQGAIVMPTVWTKVATVQSGAHVAIPGAPNPDNGEDSTGGAPIDDSQIAATSTWSSKNIVDKLCPAFTESGDIVTCEPVEGYPLEVVSTIEPVQEGSGDPSPDNIRTIIGHAAANLYHFGANLLPYPYYDKSRTFSGVTYTVHDDGSVTLKGTATGSSSFRFAGAAGSGDYAAPLPVWIIPGMTYTLSPKNSLPSGARLLIYFYNDAGTNIGYITTSKGTTAVIPTGAVKYWALIHVESGVTVDHTIYPMLQLGAASTVFEAFKQATVTAELGQTIYGGSFDWQSGVLTVDRAKLTLNGTETYHTQTVSAEGCTGFYTSLPAGVVGEQSVVCSHGVDTESGIEGIKPNAVRFDSTLSKLLMNMKTAVCGSTPEDFQMYLQQQVTNGTPFTVIYTLASPITIQLTPQEILALSGTNTLCSDTGDTTVTGRADPVAVTEKQKSRLAALEAALINT